MLTMMKTAFLHTMLILLHVLMGKRTLPGLKNMLLIMLKISLLNKEFLSKCLDMNKSTFSGVVNIDTIELMKLKM